MLAVEGVYSVFVLRVAAIEIVAKLALFCERYIVE
jgi:hypothetical protein